MNCPGIACGIWELEDMNDPKSTISKRVEHLDNMLLLNLIQGFCSPIILIASNYKRDFQGQTIIIFIIITNIIIIVQIIAIDNTIPFSSRFTL